MRGRSVVSPHDQSATFVELFFDLVFVFGITQVVGLLYGNLTWSGALEAVLVFWLLWWAWTQFTWALNAADTEHPWIQLGTLAATAVAFFMAVAVPGAYEQGGAIWFALPYVAVRIIGLTLYIGVMRENEEGRKAVRAFAIASIGGLAAAIMGALGQENQVMFWFLVIVLDFVAASTAGDNDWQIHPEHFAERHGLIVIIALGESLIVAASGLVGAERTPELLWVGFLAVMITCGLWWTYFPVAKPELEEALKNAPPNQVGALARDAFSWAHFPMLCGVIAFAVGIEAAVHDPSHALTAAQRLALSIGLFLFVGGLALALLRASCSSLRWSRIVVSVITALAVFFVAGSSAAVSLTIAFAGVATVAILEERLAERLLIREASTEV